MDQAAIDRGDFLPEELEQVKVAPEAEKDEGDELDTTPEAEKEEAEKEEAEKEEAEKEEAEKEEVEKEDEPQRDDKGRFIPKQRFDQAVNKEREAREAAERRAADLERQLNERQKSQSHIAEVEKLEAEISKLDKQYAELLVDGEGEKAAEVARQMRALDRQIARAEVAQESSRATNQALEAERFEVAVAKLEADHPELNPQSEQYDRELVDYILLRQGQLVSEGMAPSKAIADATKKAYELIERLRSTGEKEPAPKAEKGLSAAAAGDRKAAQVAKNLDAMSRQPANLKNVGLDSDKLGEKALPNIGQMSAEEYHALPEATKARLRGDLG